LGKSKKYLAIGDVHGDLGFLTRAYYYAKLHKFTPVFLGDFVDSFVRSKREQEAVLMMMLDILTWDKDAYALWGNHDLSYIFPRLHSCSGFSMSKMQAFLPYYNKLLLQKNFRPFLYLDGPKKDVLLSHAGLEPRHLPGLGTDESKVKSWLTSRFADRSLAIRTPNPLLDVGFASGGKQSYGGITWLRAEETNFGFESILQVVGHTPVDEAYFDAENNFYYIDTLASKKPTLALVDLEENAPNTVVFIKSNEWMFPLTDRKIENETL